MTMMRAIYLTGHGGNEVVEIGLRPKPLRKKGEVLVRIKSAGLNRVDLYMRNSGAGITHTIPQIMGVEGAGEIVELDEDEKFLTLGQAVVIHPCIGCGRCEFCRRGDQILCLSMQILGEHRDGTFAEYVSVPAEHVFAMPAGWSFQQAAALGVAYPTAWRMVFTQGDVKPWNTVLIFGIGGSVSLSALQMVKMIGARAIVTSRDDEKLAQAKALGADEVINGAQEDIAARALELTDGRGVDVVIENVGEAVWSAALKSVVRGGRIVTCGATTGGAPSADLHRIFIRQLKIFGSTHSTLGEFKDMLVPCARNILQPVLDREYDFDDIHQAFDRLDQGRQFGKIGLRVNS